MYKVSEFSALTGLSKETLRYYAQVGLLEPVFVDPANQYRYYDDGSYLLALLLAKLRGFGLTIHEMKTVMNDKSFDNLEKLLLKKKKNIESEIEELRSKVADIDEFIESGKERDK
ncbi:transcriptional regulator [Halobacillus halophilus]|uniref:GlnR/MerR family transcription regulator n=1 Tax=Halobacillus halophilus (strain ATCC 35676 / DSM 2266 / JCM 20832 / KCTC 3685 / LMG 17431 / NBRC 102448 / NCIMB 2269) TaxID=866895 RepID=I0JR19_HALH3|nr:MerR family transcriptional regulator [Halobacillus halophilus]ASF40587.1 transcriptional regulator [Halobacillus halophilus]CCG46589.1 GlnR/MerR family transcription regulator [Halobacillus halophilus DSM 2266]